MQSTTSGRWKIASRLHGTLVTQLLIFFLELSTSAIVGRRHRGTGHPTQQATACVIWQGLGSINKVLDYLTTLWR